MSERGRPTDFGPDIADHICSEIASGRSLRSICTDDGMPDKSTVFRWLSKHETFRDLYTCQRCKCLLIAGNRHHSPS